MPLYQNSVLNKYLKQQDKDVVAKAFKKFTKYFQDPKIQENIRSSKEEEYQGIFLTELFSKILGYTMKPNANFNLVAEYKNEKNSRKADGAILKDNEALGVIELKGTNTKDLEKVRQQAFDYKANQTGCVYVITSNFEKIRFYINNAVDFEEFDLFNLNQERFELLYLCLAQENLINNIPLKIKEASVQEEEAITKKFYKDYSTFKRELYRDLVKLNMKNEVFRTELNIEDADRANKNIKHNLFKKSQKLIDRFLFIFFAEDRGLLPPNSALKILEQWNKLKDLDAYTPLYQRYQLYFTYLDQGRKGTDKSAEIFAYNGGLFKPDPVLDSLKISDELLAKHTAALQAYDFESQVDVNILGHIFENSLNEIESVNAEIEGTDFDKQTTKRKKDGVFYTPKYITKYIVDNTVGKLCAEKKTELGVIEEEYLKSRKGRSKTKLKELLDSLEAYREWLLQITILDPACGSGAFLNQALDFLIKEHQYIDELQTNLLGGGFVFPDIENTVLENNIFGVDINEESVEIAKLSLWLRTAQPRRKLNDLSSNIKCGNSLIDSKTIAGDKAFKWEEEFAFIFEKGGFDVVIGNPPYLGGRDWKDQDGRDYKYFIDNYEVAEYQFDMYVVFWEKGVKLIKESGLIGFITPNTWLNNLKTEKLRKFILSNTTVIEVADYSEVNVFEDAVVLPVVFILKKAVNKIKTKIYRPIDSSNDLVFSHHISQDFWLKEDYGIININIRENEKLINNKIETGSKKLEDFAVVKFGIKLYETGKGTPPQLAEFSKTNVYESNSKKDDTYRRYLEGKDINTYTTIWKSRWLKYGRNLAAPRTEDLFEGPRLLVRRITGKRLISTYTDEDYVTSQLLQIVKPNDYTNTKWLLAILNSSLIAFFFKRKYNRLDKAFPEIRIYELRELPIKEIKDVRKDLFTKKVDLILDKSLNFQDCNNKFVKYLQAQFTIEKLTKKLQNWNELEFGDFIKELNKAIKKAGGEKLTKIDEMEWMEVFETKKKEAQVLKTEIDKTDNEIDQMVYELYGLTEDEILIVENN